MSQAQTKKVTANSIMRSAAFAAGVEDRLMGLPIDDRWELGQQWNYEYGRLWQAATKEQQVRLQGGVVLASQQASFTRIYLDGTIPPMAKLVPRLPVDL